MNIHLKKYSVINLVIDLKRRREKKEEKVKNREQDAKKQEEQKEKEDRKQECEEEQRNVSKIGKRKKWHICILL